MQSSLQRGAGGRVEYLEKPECFVDEFKEHGETNTCGITRRGEDLFKEYDTKLKQAEVCCVVTSVCASYAHALPLQAQYDTTTHVKTPASATPASATPTQQSTYSQLNRHDEEGEKRDEQYHQLDRTVGRHEGEVSVHRDLAQLVDNPLSVVSPCKLYRDYIISINFSLNNVVFF